MKTFRHLLCWFSVAALAAAALPLSAEPALMVGQLAPAFSGHDQDGHRWKLSRHLGKKYVLLYFYPADDTIGGTTEACGIRDNLVEFKQAGVEVVGVSSNNKKSHQEFAFKYGLPFRLLADTSGEIAEAYGVHTGEFNTLDSRITFLIGLDGRILRITNSPDPRVHLRAMGEEIVELSRHDSL